MTSPPRDSFWRRTVEFSDVILEMQLTKAIRLVLVYLSVALRYTLCLMKFKLTNICISGEHTCLIYWSCGAPMGNSLGRNNASPYMKHGTRFSKFHLQDRRGKISSLCLNCENISRWLLSVPRSIIVHITTVYTLYTHLYPHHKWFFPLAFFADNACLLYITFI